jgi:hypothetical protein
MTVGRPHCRKHLKAVTTIPFLGGGERYPTVWGRGGNEWQDRRPHRPARERAATGIGRPVGSSIRVVDMDLEPEPIAVVTIRYDFRRPGHRPEPRPGFAPEPGPVRERGWAPARDDDRFAPEP